jgi:hypothetical protein
MKDQLILMSSPMIRGLQAEAKSETRRVVKPQPDAIHCGEPYWYVGGYRAWPYRSVSDPLRMGTHNPLRCPYGQPGDKLRVKEAAWMWCERRPNGKTKTGRDKWLYVPMREAPIHYAADNPRRPTIDVKMVSPDIGNQWGWRLKIGRFLPSWAIRITLEITDVRVEMLKDICEGDAIAEGGKEVQKGGWSHLGLECNSTEPSTILGSTAVDSYRMLWESLNGEGSWDANPLVWVISFCRTYQDRV